MRKFVRSITVRGKAQFTIVDDSERRQFEVWRWRAADRSIACLTEFPYAPSCGHAAKPFAVRYAVKHAEAEKAQAQA